MKLSGLIRALFVVGLLAPPSLAGPVHIVVNMGDYPSAQAASDDEANIGWDDGKDADDVICTECFAACELQQYLRKITGDNDRFDVVDDDKVPADGALILIGNPKSNKVLAGGAMKLDLNDAAFDALGREGYLIKTGKLNTGRQLMVVGGKTRIGTLYGVYGLLDRLGVRWFAPGEIGEEVPQAKIDALPDMDVTDKPMFFTRGFHAWEYRGNPEFFDWMVRNRMNYWCVEAKNRTGLKKRGIQMNCGNHVLIPLFLGPKNEYPYDHPKFTGDESKPADPYEVGDQYQGDKNKDGKLSYFEAHPEWYGLRGGKRSDHIVGDGGDNFCTANPDALTEFFKNLVQDMIDGNWKDADSLNFWTLDGGRWCECEKCKALGISSDRNLLLVHRCCQEFKKARAEGRLNRDIMIYFLAYADVLEPPTRPLPPDFDYDRCIATYFPIARCYVHTLNDPKCTEYNTRYEQHLRGWAIEPDRHYKGQLFIGEYYNVSGYKCLPIMFARTMSIDMPYYYDMGARHMHYMHCTTKNWGTKALTNYQFARMLWDPKLDSKALLDEYLAKRYGPAADVMRRLYERLDTALCNVTELKYALSGRLRANSKDLFPRKHMKYEPAKFDDNNGPSLTEMVAAIDDCQKLLAQARSMPLPQRVLSRLGEDAGPLTYAANILHFYDVIVQMTQLMHQRKRDEAAKLLPEMKRLGKALEEDTTNMAYSSSHASAPNGLVASYIPSAYQRLLGELAPMQPEHVKDLDPAKKLVIPGKDCFGGGRAQYHFGFKINQNDGDDKRLAGSNFIYAKSNGAYSLIQVTVRLKAVADGGLELTLAGMACPLQGQKDVPIGITVNDKKIFAGPSGCPEGKLTDRQFTVPADALKAGDNRIKIENTTPTGPTGGRPWFGIDRVELQAR
ncbi:MAG: DUF4838 domain-containing protein [Phycisphaerae bacterium]|nr:DUF4838 domain-containing protein [Phycisphaerae bacterium]